MKSASPGSKESSEIVTEKGLGAYIRRGHILFAIVAIVTIGVATMLTLVLLKLITEGP
jgi:hypothetical protein